MQITSGTLRRNLEAGKTGTACWLRYAHVFVYPARSSNHLHLLESVLPTRGWAFSRQLSIQTAPYRHTGQSYLGNSSIEAFLLGDSSWSLKLTGAPFNNGQASWSQGPAAKTVSYKCLLFKQSCSWSFITAVQVDWCSQTNKRKPTNQTNKSLKWVRQSIEMLFNISKFCSVLVLARL